MFCSILLADCYQLLGVCFLLLVVWCLLSIAIIFYASVAIAVVFEIVIAVADAVAVAIVVCSINCLMSVSLSAHKYIYYACRELNESMKIFKAIAYKVLAMVLFKGN